MKNIYSRIAFFALLALLFQSCYKFEEGYRGDYADSSAEFTVTLETPAFGAIGDEILFSIVAKSEYDIRSIIVGTEKNDGGEGTGYVIKPGVSSPLINHAYGTVQDNTKELDLQYKYVMPQKESKIEIRFSLIDEEGIKTKRFTIQPVPKIVQYDDVSLCTNTSARTDGFSSVDGKVYHNMTLFSTISESNLAVQKSIDFVFSTQNNSMASLVAPYDSHFTTVFTNKNKTQFKSMKSMSNADFMNLTNGSLAYYAQLDSIDHGSTNIGNLKVGDIVGFKTDFASANSFKYGILRINAIHPANCEGYDGLSFRMRMDVVTQKEN
jgi:hypothetical protein